MNHAETKDLLRVVGQNYLAFKITDQSIRTWTNALSDMLPADALDALDAHIRASTYPPTPAHLRLRLREISSASVESRPGTRCGHCDPDFPGFVSEREQHLVRCPPDEPITETITRWRPCRDCSPPTGRADHQTFARESDLTEAEARAELVRLRRGAPIDPDEELPRWIGDDPAVARREIAKIRAILEGASGPLVADLRAEFGGSNRAARRAASRS